MLSFQCSLYYTKVNRYTQVFLNKIKPAKEGDWLLSGRGVSLCSFSPVRHVALLFKFAQVYLSLVSMSMYSVSHLQRLFKDVCRDNRSDVWVMKWTKILTTDQAWSNCCWYKVEACWRCKQLENKNLQMNPELRTCLRSGFWPGTCGS